MGSKVPPEAAVSPVLAWPQGGERWALVEPEDSVTLGWDEHLSLHTEPSSGEVRQARCCCSICTEAAIETTGASGTSTREDAERELPGPKGRASPRWGTRPATPA